ncbi:hypothetical protein Pcinc_033949 [Petrolisthes cinctipes]|uniref:Uncharacterized protein n=1 Tax=Petrolisthes cinctipes TaxID=88211 RepID=A0AAE1ER74_PETCI|nr:hypothetical protein Pcinc_033949 [Petrolisthes cinctipes]
MCSPHSPAFPRLSQTLHTAHIHALHTTQFHSLHTSPPTPSTHPFPLPPHIPSHSLHTSLPTPSTHPFPFPPHSHSTPTNPPQKLPYTVISSALPPHTPLPQQVPHTLPGQLRNLHLFHQLPTLASHNPLSKPTSHTSSYIRFPQPPHSKYPIPQTPTSLSTFLFQPLLSRSRKLLHIPSYIASSYVLFSYYSPTPFPQPPPTPLPPHHLLPFSFPQRVRVSGC